MTNRIISGACSAVVLSAAIAAGQTSSQAPSQAPVQSGTQGASQQQIARPAATQTQTQVTVIGCVTREAGSEFTLTNATTSSTSASASAASGSGAAGATGTSGRGGASAGGAAEGNARSEASPSTAGRTADPGDGAGTPSTTYSLTGDRESDLEKYVDQRVEIVGTIDRAATVEPAPPSSTAPGVADDRGRTPTTRPEGNAPAGTTSGGASAQSQSAHMQRLTVVSFKPVPGGGC